MDADLHFYFDPVCPFAWMTSKWVRMVAAQRDYQVDWRFISLRILNVHIDYDAHFPPEPLVAETGESTQGEPTSQGEPIELPADPTRPAGEPHER